MLRDLGQFLIAVFVSWELLFFGVGAAFAVGYEVASRQWKSLPEIPQPIIWAYLGLCLFLALFHAWRTEHLAAEAARVEIASLSEPRLSLKIEQVNTAPLPADRTLITLLASVSNAGTASIAEDFRLSVVLPDGRTVRPNGTYFGKALELKDTSGTSRVFPTSEYLPNKVSSTPLQQGSKVRGYLTFISNEPIDGPMPEGTKLELTALDVLERTVQHAYRLEGGNAAPRYYPGLNIETN